MCTSEPLQTLAIVAIDVINASATILTRIARAFVDIIYKQFAH